MCTRDKTPIALKLYSRKTMQLTQSLVTDGNTCSVESRKSCMQLFSGTLPQQAEITKK